MKKHLKVFAVTIALLVLFIAPCKVTVNAEASDSKDVFIVEDNEKGMCYKLIVYPTAFEYDFIVIWEDSEGLDILSRPWTGINGGRSSSVEYRKQYHEHVRVNGVVRNNRGNVFFRLVDGNYVYSGDVAFDFEANAELLNNYHALNMGDFYYTFYKMNLRGGVMDVITLDPLYERIPYNTYFRSEDRLTTKTAEELGNMMYGYVGLDIGLDKYMLQAADILANVIVNHKFDFNNYLYSYNDDPEDADSIDEGINYYERTH